PKQDWPTKAHIAVIGGPVAGHPTDRAERMKLHRFTESASPSLKRKDSTSGRRLLRRGISIRPMSALGPACVKTHTSAKSRKYNCPTRYRTSCAQHDSTPWCAISSRCFYVRGGRWGFRTAKVIHDRCGRSHASMSVRCCPKAAVLAERRALARTQA